MNRLPPARENGRTSKFSNQSLAARGPSSQPRPSSAATAHGARPSNSNIQEAILISSDEDEPTAAPSRPNRKDEIIDLDSDIEKPVKSTPSSSSIVDKSRPATNVSRVSTSVSGSATSMSANADSPQVKFSPRPSAQPAIRQYPAPEASSTSKSSTIPKSTLTPVTSTQNPSKAPESFTSNLVSSTQKPSMAPKSFTSRPVLSTQKTSTALETSIPIPVSSTLKPSAVPEPLISIPLSSTPVSSVSKSMPAPEIPTTAPKALLSEPLAAPHPPLTTPSIRQSPAAASLLAPKPKPGRVSAFIDSESDEEHTRDFSPRELSSPSLPSHSPELVFKMPSEQAIQLSKVDLAPLQVAHDHETSRGPDSAKQDPPSHPLHVSQTSSISSSAPLVAHIRSTPRVLEPVDQNQPKIFSHLSQASSISSATPLVAHVRENRKRREPDGAEEAIEMVRLQGDAAAYNNQPEPDFRSLVETLRGFKMDMEREHRAATYWKLNDAKRAIEEAIPSKFIDKVDPFASLQPEPVEKSIPAGCSREKIKYYTYKQGKPSEQKSTSILATRFKDDITPVPSYKSYTNIQRNILTADIETLKYLPIGEDYRDFDDKFHKEIKAQFIAKRSEDILDFERAYRLQEWLDRWLESLAMGLDQQLLRRHVLTLPNITTTLRIKPRELELVRDTSNALKPEERVLAIAFYKAFREVFDIGLEKVVWPKEKLKEMIDASKATVHSTPERSPLLRKVGSTFVELSCLICGIIDCPTHGDFGDEGDSENEHEHLRDHEHRDLALPYREVMRKYLHQKKLKSEETHTRDRSVCSDSCYLSVHELEEYEFTNEKNVTAIKNMMTVLDDPTRGPCHIAFSLGMPCWQVHQKVKHLKEAAALERIEESEQEETVPKGAKRPDWYDNRRKILKGDLGDQTHARNHGKRNRSYPCQHEGPCDSKCQCAKEDILCERYCCCGDDCPRKFTGCSCHASGINCVAETCICKRMNRECGSECKSCGALERINPVNKHNDDLFKTGCQNVYIQRAVSKKMVLGESQLEGVGFGLYILDPAQKGEYLGEYAGELISEKEADRRGLVYDRNFRSFLFDLNAQMVVDAAKMGNKTRFINHAYTEGQGLNVKPEIVFVNGEHRIKFVALRDIKVGEELLFNYGKEFAEKHGLNKTLPNVAKLKAGEIDEGPNNGSTARKRIRGPYKTRGGGGGGTRGGKRPGAGRSKGVAASKLAPGKPLHEDANEEDDIDEVEQEDEINVFGVGIKWREENPEDDEYQSVTGQNGNGSENGSGSGSDGEGGGDGSSGEKKRRMRRKRKRTVRVPARYTR